jgi:hypothetical protein
MAELAAILPNGKIVSRKTNRAYRFICAIRNTKENVIGDWFPIWCMSFEKAKEREKYWQRKSGRMYFGTFETHILPLCELSK